MDWCYHTLKHMREELSLPDLSSKGVYEDWLRKGGLSLEQVAKIKAQELLNALKPLSLDEDKIEEMERIIKEAKKMHGLKE